MDDTSLVAGSLSLRARIATSRSAESHSGSPIGQRRPQIPDPALIDSLRHHLHAGETHYPVRPGMVQLREGVDARLVELGFPSRGAESVLITASEEEALFVTLLGLGLFPGGSLIGPSPGRHEALLHWMEIPVVEALDEASERPAAHFRPVGTPPLDPTPSDVPSPLPTPRIVAVGDALFGGDPPVDSPDDILVGSLDGIDGMAPFTLGFVAAEPELVKRITKWKQASAICSPAPSQRAALFALGVRP